MLLVVETFLKYFWKKIQVGKRSQIVHVIFYQYGFFSCKMVILHCSAYIVTRTYIRLPTRVCVRNRPTFSRIVLLFVQASVTCMIVFPMNDVLHNYIYLKMDIGINFNEEVFTLEWLFWYFTCGVRFSVINIWEHCSCLCYWTRRDLRNGILND